MKKQANRKAIVISAVVTALLLTAAATMVFARDGLSGSGNNTPLDIGTALTAPTAAATDTVSPQYVVVDGQRLTAEQAAQVIVAYRDQLNLAYGALNQAYAQIQQLQAAFNGSQGGFAARQSEEAHEHEGERSSQQGTLLSQQGNGD